MNVKAVLSSFILLIMLLIGWGLWELEASSRDKSAQLLIRELVHDGNRWTSISESFVESNRRTVVKRFATNAPHELISETSVVLDREVCNELFAFFKPLGQTSFNVCLDDSRQVKPACIKKFLGWLDIRFGDNQSR